MFQDYLFFGVDSKVFYSYRMLHLSKLVEETRKRHNLSLEKGLYLSDVLLGSVLMASLLDYEERINLRVHCGQDFTIGVETTFQAQTRGYFEGNDESPIVKQIEKGEKPEVEFMVRTLRSQRKKQGYFEGITSMQTASLQEALNDHLQSSYQMNTKLKISSWIDESSQTLRAFGAIYQELPEIPAQVSSTLQTYVKSLPSMKELYLFNSDPDILAQKLIPDETKSVKSINPEFVCACSPQKCEDAISAFPLHDIEDMLKKGDDIHIKCHYCSTNHIVLVDKIAQLYTRLATKGQLN